MRFFTRCLPIAVTLPMFVYASERENFLHRNVANLPQNATEVVRFLKMFKIWVFFEISTCGKFFLENVVPPFLRLFWQKSEKN